MKDPISQDLFAAALKTAPTATITAATYDPSKLLSHAAVAVTILVGLAQFFTVMVNNWGGWISWWVARYGDLRRFVAWARGRA